MTAPGLLSWGRFPMFPQTSVDCHWRADLLAQLQETQRTPRGVTLGYGAGRSYGDSCLAASDHVLRLRPLDRFISADWSTGLLTAEAGITLEEILAVSIPRGWFLPVTPGTCHATLGGAIANDVHGKNHHRRGTFGRHVSRFGLVRSDLGSLTCSPTENPEFFGGTIGGLGLTGLIEWAQIQLVPIRSSRIHGIVQRFGNLDEFFSLSLEHDAHHEFSVSWVDCLAHGKVLGRGVYSAGDFAEEGSLNVVPSHGPSMLFTPPVSLINGISLRIFNGIYWRRAPRQRANHDFSYAQFFYPLDSVGQWNRLYGRHGFQQYQCVVPPSTTREGIREMLGAVAQSGVGSFLAVLKRFGDLRSPGLLSCPQPGTTLALDFPQGRGLGSGLFSRLDSIVNELGGRLYPAKDAHMKGEDFRRAYPAWSKLEALRDPVLMSRFWRRVTE